MISKKGKTKSFVVSQEMAEFIEFSPSFSSSSFVTYILEKYRIQSYEAKAMLKLLPDNVYRLFLDNLYNVRPAKAIPKEKFLEDLLSRISAKDMKAYKVSRAEFDSYLSKVISIPELAEAVIFAMEYQREFSIDIRTLPALKY